MSFSWPPEKDVAGSVVWCQGLAPDQLVRKPAPSSCHKHLLIAGEALREKGSGMRGLVFVRRRHL